MYYASKFRADNFIESTTHNFDTSSFSLVNKDGYITATLDSEPVLFIFSYNEGHLRVDSIISGSSQWSHDRHMAAIELSSIVYNYVSHGGSIFILGKDDEDIIEFTLLEEYYI